MKEKTKFALGTFFRSLFSNDAAIEGAKKAPWWIGIVMGVVSVLLPLIPLTVSTVNTKGSQSLGTYALNTDTYLTAASLAAKANNTTFEIVNGECLMKVNGSVVERDNEAEASEPIYTYTASANEIGENNFPTGNVINTYAFQVYYTSLPFSSKEQSSVKDVISNISKRTYRSGTTTLYVEEEPLKDGESLYAPSYVVIYKTGIYFSIHQEKSTTIYAYTAYNSDWKHTKDCDLLDRVLTVEGYDTEASKNINNYDYVQGVYNNWKKVVDETYETAKVEALRNSLLIYGGVYLLLVILMGFMLWLLTRGKNNMFNYLTFWVTTKISCWSSLSPAILALILGFIIPKFAAFMFIILLGLRVMWISMKQLRPYQ